MYQIALFSPFVSNNPGTAHSEYLIVNTSIPSSYAFLWLHLSSCWLHHANIDIEGLSFHSVVETTVVFK